MARKHRVAKAAPAPEEGKDKVCRLTDIDPEFVSLVRAGANRQRSFMVVKEDGAETVEEDHEPTSAAMPDVVDGLDAEGHMGSGTKSDGNETTPVDAPDLASWLSDATEQLEALSLDIAIQRALDTHAVDEAAPGPASKQQAQEIGKAAAPAVTKDDGVEREKATRLEVELAKTRRENLALKAKAARLAAATVGRSSVILTGEVTSKQSRSDRKTQQSPSRGAFNCGSDIAAAVARSEGPETGDRK